jgi:hypothetical protein
MSNSGQHLRILLGVLLLAGVVAGLTAAETGDAVQSRIDADVANGMPIVVHVVVALCDNANQGIVPVPAALGDGQNPRTNLYWGALYGVRTHLPRAGWSKVDAVPSKNNLILERSVFFLSVKRGENSVPVYVVADAWDGANIREALQAYLGMAAGGSVEQVDVTHDSNSLKLQAGGNSHLIAYVGHNGLMEFLVDAPASPPTGTVARSAVVLACVSKSYFLKHLKTAGAHPLVLTTGLMAPEAYTLDSVIRSWVGDGATSAAVEAAAAAYNRYQKCGLRAAQRLFWGSP